MKNSIETKSLSKFKLYSYWRSSASWRVRWALLHKSISFEIVSINLLKNEQQSPEYKLINPAASVPAIQFENGQVYSESSAILEFIEESVPNPPLLPDGIQGRLIVRELSQLITSGIHPLQNLKLLTSLFDSQEEKSKFASKWIRQGLEVYSEILRRHQCKGVYSFANSLSFADLCLIPQLYNARRHGVNISEEFPDLKKIEDECFKLNSAKLAHPDQQPDALKTS